MSWPLTGCTLGLWVKRNQDRASSDVREGTWLARRAERRRPSRDYISIAPIDEDKHTIGFRTPRESFRSVGEFTFGWPEIGGQPMWELEADRPKR